jgi:hypothetical protein
MLILFFAGKMYMHQATDAVSCCVRSVKEKHHNDLGLSALVERIGQL